MQTCSNCGGHFSSEDGGLVLKEGTRVVAAVCADCSADALAVKISLRRPRAAAPFEYDQYIPYEMARKAAAR